MSNKSHGGVIVFDNLFHARDADGQEASLNEVIAIQAPSEPFTNSNAAGALCEVENLEQIKECALNAGKRLKSIFGESVSA